MKDESMSRDTSLPRPDLVGTERLTARLWKIRQSTGSWNYSFAIDPLRTIGGRETNSFQAVDLEELVLLARILAIVILEDGYVELELRHRLQELVTRLDSIFPRVE